MNKLDKFSNWQKNLVERHPLACQVCTRVIAGLLVVAILAGVGWLIAWPKPRVTSKRVSKKSSKITISNKGLFPVSIKYSVLSDDTEILPKGPGVHIRVIPTKDKKIKIIDVKSLPWFAPVEIDVTGEGSAKITAIASGNTVAFVPKYDESTATGYDWNGYSAKEKNELVTKVYAKLGINAKQFPVETTIRVLDGYTDLEKFKNENTAEITLSKRCIDIIKEAIFRPYPLKEYSKEWKNSSPPSN